MLRSLIEERGESVYKVAKGAGIPYTTLNELVNGKKNVCECNIKTISALANYFSISIDSLYSKLLLENKIAATADGAMDLPNRLTDNISAPSIKIAQTWQDKRYKQYKFPVIKQSPNYDASRIHPLKQRLIYEIAKALEDQTEISEMIIFGSSTTIRCNKKSDIDVAIKLKDEYINLTTKGEISEKIQKLCNWNSDIVWMDRVKEDSKLFNNIKRGVKII